MGDGTLVFFRPHDGTGHLVFGDTGGAAAAPDAVIGLDAGLPGLDGAVLLRTGPVLGLDADLPGLDGTVELLWDANVSRGGLRHELQACWQEAAPVAAGLQARWQEATALRAATQARWQQAQRTSHGVRTHWQDTERLRGAVLSRWQEGAGLRHGVVAAWQETERLRAAVLSRWQEGTGLRHGVAAHWQEMHRMRAAVLSHWQDAVPLRAAVQARYAQGVPTRVALRAHWQEARRPPPGVSAAPPVEPPEPPCYDPAAAGRLVFTDLALGDGRLVFVCQRGGGLPGATIVVPVRRVYMTVNNVDLTLADGRHVRAFSFGMSLDVDSWTWQWSASLHESALPLIAPGPDGAPVQVFASINGVQYRLLAEGYGRERSFEDTRIKVNGRGLAALLDVPYSPATSHANGLDRTAQQLMGDVLTVNGVGFGWAVDFGLTDWLVPGGVWSHYGSYMSALREIAGAAGGYLQPHDTAQIVRVLHRYPSAPWDWAARTPDFELPSAVVSVEGIDWLRKAAYDRVYVGGVSAGFTGNVKRAGTAGLLVAQGVVHPLITAEAAIRQRGIAELGSGGNQAHISLRLPVLAETGVIKPGAFVRYVDAGDTYLGLVRSTSVEWTAPDLEQVISVETHIE